MKTRVKQMTYSAMIAAIYFILCFFQQDFASGAIQCRLSEGLTLLPLFFPEAILGVTIGCLIWNIMHGVLYDVIFGTLATLIACILTYLIGKLVKNDFLRILLGGIPPIIINALVIPLVILFGYGETMSYGYLFLTIGLGQLIAVCVVGTIIYFPLKEIFKKISIL